MQVFKLVDVDGSGEIGTRTPAKELSELHSFGQATEPYGQMRSCSPQHRSHPAWFLQEPHRLRRVLSNHSALGAHRVCPSSLLGSSSSCFLRSAALPCHHHEGDKQSGAKGRAKTVVDLVLQGRTASSFGAGPVEGNGPGHAGSQETRVGLTSLRHLCPSKLERRSVSRGMLPHLCEVWGNQCSGVHGLHATTGGFVA